MGYWQTDVYCAQWSSNWWCLYLQPGWCTSWYVDILYWLAHYLIWLERNISSPVLRRPILIKLNIHLCHQFQLPVAHWGKLWSLLYKQALGVIDCDFTVQKFKKFDLFSVRLVQWPTAVIVMLYIHRWNTNVIVRIITLAKKCFLLYFNYLTTWHELHLCSYLCLQGFQTVTFVDIKRPLASTKLR